MASTIQIKRGTGTSVPSGLADGELAINLDERKIYFGSSSATVILLDSASVGTGGGGGGTTTNALTVDNTTLQLDSGTTFNGSAARTISIKDGGVDSDALAANISVTQLTSSIISASGTAFANAFKINNFDALGTSGTKGRVFADANITGIQIGREGASDRLIELLGPVTASGNISSSGNIIVNSATFNDTIKMAEQNGIEAAGLHLSGSNRVRIINGTTTALEIKNTHLTASGDISASNTIFANVYKINNKLALTEGSDVGTLFQDISSTGTINLGKSTSTPSIFTNGSITSSKSISASGTITANAFVGSITGTVTGTATGLAGTPDITVGAIEATRLNVTSITSSIVTSSILQTEGSNIFGDSANDTQTFNGSVIINNNITASGAISQSGFAGTNFFSGRMQIDGNIVAGGLETAASLAVGTAVIHTGDPNTKISFDDDKITLTAGGLDMITLTEAGSDTIALGAAVSTSFPITASANISSSGTITMLTASIGGGIFTSSSLAGAIAGGGGGGTTTNALTVDNATLQLNSGTTFDGSAAKTISIKDGGVDSDALAANISVTQLTSSIISASGDLSITGKSFFGGHITASGNISSSGNFDLTGNANIDGNLDVDGTTNLDVVDIDSHITIANSAKIKGENSSGFTRDIAHISSGNQIIFGQEQQLIMRLLANKIQLSAAEGDIQFQTSSLTTIAFNTSVGHITASGNISSSGTITAATLDASAVSDTLAAAIVAEIDNDEIPIAKLAEDAVTINSGTNLSGGGSVTLGGAITLNVDDAFLKNNADDTTSGKLTTAGLNSTSHITASGNISSSGKITAAEFELGNGVFSVSTIGNITTANNLVAGNSETLDIHTLTGRTSFIGNVTASGDVSSSGTIIGNTATIDGNIQNTNGFALFQRSSTGNNSVLNVRQSSTGNIAEFGTDSANELLVIGPGAHITASGNISASGDIIANSATLNSATFTDTIKAANIKGIETVRLHLSGSDLVKIFNGTTNALEIKNNHITASGNISSSGTIHAANFITDNFISLDTSGTQGRVFSDGAITSIQIGRDGASDKNIELLGPVTASGNISSSGTILANQIETDSLVGHIGDANTGLAFGSDTIVIKGNNESIATFATNRIVFTEHITASANISSSGTITMLTASIGGGTFTSASLAGAIAGGGGGGAVSAVTNGSNNRIATFTSADALKGETNLTFDGTNFEVARRKFSVPSSAVADAVGDVVYLGSTSSMDNGKIYYLNGSGTWALANADAIASSKGLLAVALGSASDTDGMLIRGSVTLDHDPGDVGDVLYLSTTAGEASSTAPSGTGDVVRIIGYCLANSSGQILFDPDKSFVELA